MTKQKKAEASSDTESVQVRDCRVTVLKALAQRTSSRAPWYRTIGVDAARTATSGLLDCRNFAPRDVLRSMELPQDLTWGRFAEILRGNIETGD